MIHSIPSSNGMKNSILPLFHHTKKQAAMHLITWIKHYVIRSSYSSAFQSKSVVPSTGNALEIIVVLHSFHLSI